MAAWHDLRQRQLARVRELGFRDLSEFSEAHWEDTWTELAHRLDSSVIPWDLRQWLRAEAVAWGLVHRHVRGALLRYFSKKLPNGWGPTDDGAAHSAMAAWSGDFEEDWARSMVVRVSRHLERTHPPNWKPRDPDDPILVAAFEAADFPYEKVTSPFPIEPRAAAPGDNKGDR